MLHFHLPTDIYFKIGNSGILLLFLGVPAMVQDAKAVAVNPSDHNAVSRWRDSNKAVSIFDFLVIFSKCKIFDVYLRSS